jgi:hypothetical protein
MLKTIPTPQIAKIAIKKIWSFLSCFLAHFLQKVPQLRQGIKPDFSTSFPRGISL